jgi:hypothetical protein
MRTVHGGAAVVIAALIGSGLTPLVSGGVAIAAPAKPACVAAVQSSVEAAALAAACNARVEVLGERSETAQVFAKPSGGMTMEESVVPRFAKRPDGSWTDVDTTLQLNADGSVAPKAAVLPISFSGGGTDAFATLRDGAQNIALTWPEGSLPKPTLEGNKARYAEVLPGVDLTVTASATGFSHSLIVKTRAAAANPALKSVAFGFSSAGLTTRATETGLEAVDAKGRPVFVAPTPVMWDAGAKAPAGAAKGLRAATHDGDIVGRKQSPMPAGIGDGRLTLTPDQTVLTAADTQFPVEIDPSWSGGVRNGAWTIVVGRSDMQNKSLWQNGTFLNDASTYGGAGTGLVCDYSSNGACTSKTYGVRTYLRMDTSGIANKRISKATFRIKQYWSWTCSPATQARIVYSDAISPSTTWNSQPTLHTEATKWADANHRVDSAHGCAGAGDDEFDVTDWMQNAANANWQDLTIGLLSGNEDSVNGWKRFDQNTAVFAIDYNTPPNQPDNLTADGRSCGENDHRYLTTTTPTIRAHATDPDGDTMQVTYHLYRMDPSGWTNIDNRGQDSVPNGGTATWQVTTRQENALYTFRAHSWDGLDNSSWSPYETRCEWTVDTTAPTPPALEADVYKEGDATCPVEGCGGVGATGRFTFTSAPDVVGYKWGFTDPPSTYVSAPGLGQPVTVDWTPTTGGPKVLKVQAIDRAGNTSALKDYQFTVAGLAPPVAYWKLAEAAGKSVLRDSMGRGNDATATGVTLGVPGQLIGGNSAMRLDGNAGSYGKAPHLVDTTRAFSVAAWVKLSSNGRNQSVISQDGTNLSGFWLEFRQRCNCWAIVVPKYDTDTAYLSYAESPKPAAVGVWTHVAGVYDPAADKIRMYINGVQVAEAPTYESSWASNGEVKIGQNKLGGIPSDFFGGDIAQARVWTRAVLSEEVLALADPTLVGRAAEYHFGEVGAKGPAYDATGNKHDLAFVPDAQIPSSGSGRMGPGLHLDGVTGYAVTAGPVIHTDQSFTVAAWVRADDVEGYHSAVSQTGVNNSAFMLRYDGSHKKWLVSIIGNDTPAPPSVNIVSDVEAKPNTWTHLVVTYDATTRETMLFVDGRESAKTVVPGTFDAQGPFRIGKDRWEQNDSHHSPWAGDIDEVYVWQGVVLHPENLAKV